MDLEQYQRSGGGYTGELLQLSQDDLKPYALLRASGGEAVTNYGGSATKRDLERLYTFARRARSKNEARMTVMRLTYHGRQTISATHYGDLRIGCTLVAWNELIYAFNRVCK